MVSYEALIHLCVAIAQVAGRKAVAVAMRVAAVAAANILDFASDTAAAAAV